jgi:hypothetical protein
MMATPTPAQSAPATQAENGAGRGNQNRNRGRRQGQSQAARGNHPRGGASGRGAPRNPQALNSEPPPSQAVQTKPPGLGGGGVFSSRPTEDARKSEGEGGVRGGEGGEAEEDAEVCFICASVVVHHSLAPCNHRTCHICALRLRALYKTKACAHCRVSSFPFP